MQKTKPSAETYERIKNLAYVGNAVFGNGSDVSGQTNFYLAKEALLKFEEGIDLLELDDETLQGIKELIRYLNIKIDRRLEERI